MRDSSYCSTSLLPMPSVYELVYLRLFCASDPQAEAVLKSQYNGTLLKRSALIYAESPFAISLVQRGCNAS